MVKKAIKKPKQKVINREKEFRINFLKEFIRQVIIHSKPKGVMKPFPKIEEQEVEEKIQESIPIQTAQIQIAKPVQPQIKQQAPAPQMQAQMQVQASPEAQKTAQIPAFEKIKPFILDNSIQIIECPGPDKAIAITRFGRIEPTNIILSKEDINKIMNTFSEQTRIPLIQGVFKAALGSLLITSVISDYIGTRFVIQKRPQNIPQMPGNAKGIVPTRMPARMAQARF